MTSRGFIVLLLSLLLGVAAFSLVRWRQHWVEHHNGAADGYAEHEADGHHADLDWLESELAVTEAQMGKIRALHVAYHPVCEELARRLETSHIKLDKLTATAMGISPALELALKEHSEVHLECQLAMLKHFYETAGYLSPAQAQQYLRKMLPLVFQHGDLSSENVDSHSH